MSQLVEAVPLSTYERRMLVRKSETCVYTLNRQGGPHIRSFMGRHSDCGSVGTISLFSILYLKRKPHCPSHAPFYINHQPTPTMNGQTPQNRLNMLSEPPTTGNQVTLGCTRSVWFSLSLGLFAQDLAVGENLACAPLSIALFYIVN